jgi:hypothetical protein
MSKINIEKVYLDRLEQIKIDIKSAVFNKKWTEIAKLEAEKARLESKLSIEKEV